MNNKFVFSSTIIDLNLLKKNSVKRLYQYINTNDIELDKVKMLIKKANIDLRTSGRQLFIRRSIDEDIENKICITRR